MTTTTTEITATSADVQAEFNDAAVVRAVYGDGPTWVTDVKAKLPIFIPPGAKGVDAIPPVTLPQMFHTIAAKNPDKTALSWKCVDGSESIEGTPSFYHALAPKVSGSHWDSMSWKELEAECYAFGAACLEAGLAPKQAVVVMGFNSPQWLLAAHGVAMAGGVLAGSYSTNNTETCQYLAKDCNAKIVLVESWKHGSKFEGLLADQSAALSKIVVWGDMGGKATGGGVVTFSEFMATGKAMGAAGKEKVEAVEKTLDPSECVQLIYTSGTTGMPKGVMLSHDNLTWDATAAIEFFYQKSGQRMGPETVILSYLPLSHIAAQVVEFMIALATGGELFFATSDALAGAIVPLLQDARPTFFFAVPRVWEKMMDGIKAKAANNSGLKTFIATKAKAFGLAYNYRLAATAGRSSGTLGIMYAVYDKLVYGKVRQALGLDRAIVLGSGAAPISKEVLEFFWSLNVPIIEGFGMSETCVMTAQAFPNLVKLGSCGAPVSSGAIKLDTAKGTKPGEGEICMRSRNIMMGYLNKPDVTAATFDAHRYLRSGDVGTLTPAPVGDGTQLLSITGRIKELIITAGAENVPPQPIEDAIKANCPMISNAVLIGDRRKYLTILLTLRVDVDPATLIPADTLNPNCLLALKAIGSDAKTVKEAKADEKVAAAIQAGIDKYNKTQAVSRAQNIQRYVVLDSDFSVPGGELTGSLKLKKNVVLETYKAEIESMYE